VLKPSTVLFSTVSPDLARLLVLANRHLKLAQTQILAIKLFAKTVLAIASAQRYALSSNLLVARQGTARSEQRVEQLPILPAFIN